MNFSIGYPVATETVAYTGTAGTSAAVGAHIHRVRIVCTTAAYIAFDATATTAGIYVPADEPEVFTIKPGMTVSAIQVSTGGNLSVTQLTE